MSLSPRVPRLSFATTLLATLLLTQVSRADYTGVSDSQQPEPYGNQLVLAYLGAPLLAAAGTYAFAGFGRNDVDAGNLTAGIALGLLLPASVHAAHGETGLGVRTFLAWPALAFSGALLGGFIGAGTYQLFNSDSEDGDSDGWGALFHVIGGASIGLVAGGLVWPIFDIADTYDRDEVRARLQRARERERASVRIGVVPHARGGMLGTVSGEF